MLKILIIWDGVEEPLSQFRKDCLKRIREIYPDNEIICITKNPDLMKEYCNTIIKWDDMEIAVWEKWYIKTQSAKLAADCFRYHFLSEKPYILYLDTDIWLNERIEETEYIARWSTDYSALWNGSQTKFFDYIMGMRKNNSSLASLLGFYPYDCGDLSKWMSHKTKG